MKRKPLSKARQYSNNAKKVKKALADEAKRLWKLGVIEFWGEMCEVCGKPTGPPHHFFRKENFGILKYVVANGVPMCASCHTKHHRRGDPAIHIAILQKRGIEWFEILSEAGRQHYNNNNIWLKEQIKILES